MRDKSETVLSTHGEMEIAVLRGPLVANHFRVSGFVLVNLRMRGDVSNKDNGWSCKKTMHGDNSSRPDNVELEMRPLCAAVNASCLAMFLQVESD